MNRRIVCLALAALLAACETPGPAGGSYTVGGASLGQPQWRPITDAESVMRIADPPPIRRIEANDAFGARYQERIFFEPTGFVFYERIYGALDTSWGTREMAYQAFRQLGQGFGISISRDGFATTTINGIEYANGLFYSASNVCFLFFAYFGPDFGSPMATGDRSAQGGDCRRNVDGAAGRLEARWKGLLARLDFDGPKPGWMTRGTVGAGLSVPPPAEVSAAISAALRPPAPTGDRPIAIRWGGVGPSLAATMSAPDGNGGGSSGDTIPNLEFRGHNT